MTTRRAFLATLAAAAAPRLGWADAGSPAWLACAQEPDGGFALFGLSPAGEDLFRLALPARGHAGAAHPERPEAVVFARRPGTYALVLSCVSGALVHRLTPPEGLQLNGHGAFLPGGEVLATVEQVADTSEGRLGLWDATAGYRRIGSIPTGGIGPHEVLSLGGGVLAVANGGIATDPTDRTPLNLPEMRPNLTWLTLQGVVEQVETEPALRQNSIRHLAATPDGSVAFAMQWQGPAEAVVPLLGLARRGQPVVLATSPQAEQAAMQGYAGSVAASGAEIAISSPRGGQVHRFDPQGRFLGATRRADVCGLAPLGAEGFLLTDGGGGILSLRGGAARPLGLRPRAWDNHVVALPAG